MISTRQTPPRVRGLDAALGGVRGTMATVDRYRTTAGTNAEGGDVGHHASADLLVRHTVNYLLAADLAARVEAGGSLVDVGSGVAVFASWLARRLGRPLHVVDHDPRVLALTQRALCDVTTHRELRDAPVAAVVTAMEVLEHLRYVDQTAFVRALLDHVLPGGMLICSTPDERPYLGGWSGYAPHVGTLDADSLRTLLASAGGGLPVAVWRVRGPGFELGRLQKVGEPIANRLWAAAQSRVPAVTHRVAGALGDRRRARSHGFDPGPPEDSFTVTVADDGDTAGTGLIAAVYKPADAS
ncbi:MAG: class I SAM-dependent methyltransferase [Actinobacteria bacterium]|nr:class I SAM-dependent methyltransferase [Actinomycetota bacterium]